MPSPTGQPGPRWGGDGALARPAPPPDLTGEPSPEAPSPEPVRGTPGDDTAALPAMDYAPLWRRAAAWSVDELARSLFYAVLLVFVLGVSDANLATSGEVDMRVLLPQIVMRIGLSWIFWARGTSPGAALFRLRIVGPMGEVPGPRRALIRATLEVASVLGMFLGFAWALVSRKRQTWHDLAANTYVVNLPAEERRGA